MVSINYSAREVCCKIVYYGPGLSGKTTNLQYVHAKVPTNTRGNLISLATEADRTLYFDFLPINIGTINGFAAKFQLYTVPGQVYYNATRKLVLRGVDGVVFVADSQPDKMEENLESLVNLEENLREYGYDINDLPVVIQFNKRDLPGVLPVSQLNAKLNSRSWPWFEASATIGNGVFDTLKLIIKLVLEKAKGASAAKPRASAAAMATDPAFSLRGPTPAPSAEPVAPAIAAAATEPLEPVAAPPEPVGAAAAASPEPVSVHVRPFPGDRTGGVAVKRVPAPEFTPAPRPEIITPPAAVRSDSPTTAGRQASPADLFRPAAMGPPRRKRPQKRGFFKRLFGIK